MTSPGHVREVQEKILTPTKAAVAEKPSDTNTNMSPGKVKQVVETMSSLTSRGNEENTPPSKRRRPNAAELVLSDLHAATGIGDDGPDVHGRRPAPAHAIVAAAPGHRTA